MFNYFREQRQQEREMFLELIREVMTSQDRQTNLVIEQTKLLQQLLGFFDVYGEPQARVMNDQREVEIEKNRHAKTLHTT